MAIRVNPKLIDDLEKYGAEDVQNCYHCGNCSAVCPHADEVFVFPRKSMRNLQMGLESKIQKSLEPWLCYYCGQCSEQCPRDAEPGETMMSLRRWLISRYDFTGISRRLFRSPKLELAAVLVVAVLTAVAFLFYGFWKGDIHVYDGANAFLPSSFIHIVDLTIGGILVFFLAANAFRMWYFTMYKNADVRAPFSLYVKKILLLPWHFFSQKRYAECEKDSKKENRPGVFMPWLLHLGLMLGYVTMLALVMVFIERLQAGPEIDWRVHVFGYLATVGLLSGAAFMLYNRFSKKRVQYRKSHGSDWIFIVMLFFMVLTGVIQHIFHRTGLLVAANITYVVHLMFVVPWLLRMPFTKWAHLVYRPLAMYLAGIKKAALALRGAQKPDTQPGLQAHKAA